MVKIGHNPNLADDMINLFKLSSNIDSINHYLKDLNEVKSSYYDRLIALFDKLEFVEHLNHIKNEAVKNDYTIHGREVFGIDNDIDALNIYLVLSCIDMFSNVMKYEPFEQWLTNKCEDFEQFFTDCCKTLDKNGSSKFVVDGAY